MQEKFLINGRNNTKFSIQLTYEFLEEFEEIGNYISEKLKNISASNRLRKKVIHNILLLEDSPKMYPEIEKIHRTKRRYRKMSIDNYIILYTIDETKRIVYISHMYYGGKNYLDGEL